VSSTFERLSLNGSLTRDSVYITSGGTYDQSGRQYGFKDHPIDW